jgi:hypothetical protein
MMEARPKPRIAERQGDVMTAQVSVDRGLDEFDHEFVAAKFGGDSWELNVKAQATELLMLRDIRTMDWETRRSAKLGTSAGANVYWCSDGKTATIMVGHDDETWDVAVSVPVELVDDLVRQVDQL